SCRDGGISFTREANERWTGDVLVWLARHVCAGGVDDRGFGLMVAGRISQTTLARLCLDGGAGGHGGFFVYVAAILRPLAECRKKRDETKRDGRYLYNCTRSRLRNDDMFNGLGGRQRRRSPGRASGQRPVVLWLCKRSSW